MFPAASEEALDLLNKTIKFSFQERITLEEALKHPFFDKVRTLPDVVEANSPATLKKLMPR